ncbi:MAG TPA: hypothetical protein VMV75_04190 [Sulfuricella sp.]|nr:hypothetical protein [Sulfuricella sp.]
MSDAIFQTSNTTAEFLPFMSYQAATEPVGGVNESIPFHPDDRHPDLNEFRQKNKRKSTPDDQSVNPGNKRPDPEHQIDEFA